MTSQFHLFLSKGSLPDFPIRESPDSLIFFSQDVEAL